MKDQIIKKLIPLSATPLKVRDLFPQLHKFKGKSFQAWFHKMRCEMKAEELVAKKTEDESLSDDDESTDDPQVPPGVPKRLHVPSRMPVILLAIVVGRLSSLNRVQSPILLLKALWNRP